MSKAKIKFIEPEVVIFNEYHSGATQNVTEVEIELNRPIRVKYSEDDETVFETLLPVRIKVKRV